MTPGQSHLLPSHLGLCLCSCDLGAAGHSDPKFDAPPQERHDQVHFPKHMGIQSYLRVHLLTLDLGECHAGEVHAICEERPPAPSSFAPPVRPPGSSHAAGTIWHRGICSEGVRGSHGQRPQGHSQPRVVSAKSRGFGAEVCAPSIRTRGNIFKLPQRRFSLDKKENFFMKRVVSALQRLPRVR